MDSPLTIPASDITPRHVFEQRRALLQAAIQSGVLAGAGSMLASAAHSQTRTAQGARWQTEALPHQRSQLPGTVIMDKPTSYKDVTTYNNFYEFGTDKADPAEQAQQLKVKPWTLAVEGEVLKPRTWDIDALLKLAPLEERVYRLRCVEGWSMVVPWIGYSLSELIKQAQPTGQAKYVEFISLADAQQMPGLRSRVLAWPYLEGLRLDEAMHPLTLLTLGLYGETLPRQNGAPVRLTVPWKYGFKSGKSIVKIRLTRTPPTTSWMRAAPEEYGFYANVNPKVDHPRWSQATERRLGEDGLFTKKRPTLMFNGYADQVASLYTGMDLAKFF